MIPPEGGRKKNAYLKAIIKIMPHRVNVFGINLKHLRNNGSSGCLN